MVNVLINHHMGEHMVTSRHYQGDESEIPAYGMDPEGVFCPMG